jgi:glycosyltransferase involved in cell wall biosynthesis
MQIRILVPLRYPTEKAYGTNIAYTAEAFRKLGNKVEIIASGISQEDERSNQVLGIPTHYFFLANKFLESKSQIISKCGFYLSQFIFSILSARKAFGNKEESLVISRFPIVVIGHFFLKQVKCGILELHHLPNRLEVFLLKLVRRKFKVIVTNIEFMNQLRELNFKGEITLIPNVSPEAFHRLGTQAHIYNLPLLVGYAGKTTSSGNDNNLDVIIDLLRKFPDISKVVKFITIGCENSFNSKVTNAYQANQIPPDSISSIGHLSHDQLILEVARFDLAIIPYPENDYYARSFPLKMIEMATAGIPMIASNTRANRRILGSVNEFMYEPGSAQSLYNRLLFLSSNLGFLEVERKRLLALYGKNTYEEKARIILDLCE